MAFRELYDCHGIRSACTFLPSWLAKYLPQVRCHARFQLSPARQRSARRTVSLIDIRNEHVRLSVGLTVCVFATLVNNTHLFRKYTERRGGSAASSLSRLCDVRERARARGRVSYVRGRASLPHYMTLVTFKVERAENRVGGRTIWSYHGSDSLSDDDRLAQGARVYGGSRI